MSEQDKKDINQAALGGDVYEGRGTDAYQLGVVLKEVHRLTGVPRTAFSEAEIINTSAQLSGSLSETTVPVNPKTSGGYYSLDGASSDPVSLTAFVRRASRKRAQALHHLKAA